MFRIGSLILGDGHVDRGGSIAISHSIAQKEFALFKQRILTEAGLKTTAYFSTGKSFISKINGKTYKNNDKICIYTSRCQLGKDLRQEFYPNNVKILPASYVLTPQDWAMLFMDDGNMNVANHTNNLIGGVRVRVNTEPRIAKYRIYTQSFTLVDNMRLQESLRDFGVESSLLSVKGGYGKYISIQRNESRLRFRELIEPFVIDSMRYKLLISPR